MGHWEWQKLISPLLISKPSGSNSKNRNQSIKSAETAITGFYFCYCFSATAFCLIDYKNINSRRWRRWKTRDSGTVPIRDWDWKVRVLISLLIMIHLTSSLIIIGKLENWLWSTSSLIIIGTLLGKYYPQRGPTKNNRDHVYEKEFGFKWFIKIAFETCVPIPFDEK